MPAPVASVDAKESQLCLEVTFVDAPPVEYVLEEYYKITKKGPTG